MRTYIDVGRIPTLRDALANHLTVGGLRKLGNLFSKSLPTRKDDLVAFLLGQSVEVDSARVFEIRSDLTIMAAGPVPVADRLFLDRIARSGGRDCWQLDRARLIAALADGRGVREIGDFLVSRATSGLPAEAEALLRELEAGARSLKDAGLARLVECVHPDLTAHLAAHPRTRDLCLRAGTHHVAVPAAKEKAFARALQQMGLVWPASL
jgi:hypothetical protein